MSDITRFLLSQKEVVIDDVEYMKLMFFDSMEGEVVTVMAPINPKTIWVRPKPVVDNGQEAIEEAIRQKSKITPDPSKVEDLQNDL